MHPKIFIALDSSLKWYQKGVSSLKLVSSQFICSKRPSTKKKEKNCWALKIQAQRCEHDKETDKVKCCCCCSVLSILWNMASGLFLFVLVFHSINSSWIVSAQVLGFRFVCSSFRLGLFGSDWVLLVLFGSAAALFSQYYGTWLLGYFCLFWSFIASIHLKQC